MAPSSHNKQSQLQIPTVPHFPLSSPITEEVPSPTSTSSDDRDLERSHPFQYLAKMSVPKSLSGKIEREEGSTDAARPYPVDGERQRGTILKEKPIGLNLVTDFSRPPQEPRPAVAAPSYVDLNDLKVLSQVREKERTAQTIKGILKKGGSYGFQRLPDEPSESAKKRSSWFDVKSRVSPKRRFKDDLSPSDRPIMIGFSVPREDSADSQKERPKELDSAGSQHTPLTPSIIVTPAKDDDLWPDFSQIHDHSRIASSIYSQPTPYLDSESTIPPVPAIPAQHAASKAEISSPNSTKRQSAISTRKLRSYSTGTVFEEDENWQPGTRSRSYSAESVKRAFDRLSAAGTHGRLSVATEYNRHQSQGWWTYLLSPLLDRSNTLFTLKTPTSANRPTLPTPTTNRSGLSDEWWEKEVSCFSPETPETAVANRGEMSNWQNADTNPFADPKFVTDTQYESSGEKDMASLMFSGGTISGAAAEYYQACAHELFSGRPYFECVNHVCSITPKDSIPVANQDTAVANEEGSRGLLVDVDDAPKSQHGSPKDPFDTPAGSRARSLSGEIESDKGRDVISPETTKNIDSTNNTVEESDRGPAPAVDSTGDREKSASTYSQNEKQNPFPFLLPNGVPPPGTQVHVQSAPTPSPAPVAFTERSVPQYIVVQPPNYTYGAPPQAPDPVSPGFQRATEQTGSIPLGDMHTAPAPAYTPHRSDDAILPPRMEPVPIAQEEVTHPVAQRDRIENRRRRLEKEDAIGKKAGGLWRGRGPVSNKGCFGRPGREGRLRRRWYVAIAAFFLAIVVAAVILAIMLTRKGDETPVQSQWLNLTGYPPMPTGIATIAGPEARTQNSGCITPSTLWSCALPKEQQEHNKPYAASQPNFRVEIRFRNGTYPNSTTVASSPSSKSVRSRDLFNPSPSAPDMKEQTFLGNTTDKNSIPFAGEITPFYMTMLSPVPLSTLTKRSDNAFPDIDSLIPSPALASDGTAADASLYPLPESQPVRLYNRGQDDEHYGFYTYFDRSIFLETAAPLNGHFADESKSDASGGPSKENAHVRCTWAQTRFLVQIWTRSQHLGMSLLGSDKPTSPTATATPASTAQSTNSSSANDFYRPGSFPYPVTITLDRHGGSAKQKMVYCYGMEVAQRINETEKKLQIEDRGFGGTLINAAPGIFNLTNDESETTTGDAGGVDGGTGGCSCQWANWISRS